MSELSPAGLLDTEEAGLPHSCYLLEFSVQPGGARQADVYAATTVDALRAIHLTRWTGFEEVDDYLLISYGALFRLWVVQEGAIAEGIDLHPYLRTGDARCDRTLARVIECRAERGARWDELADILDPYEFESATALPLLTRVLELQDRLAADPSDAEARAALDRIVADEQAPASYDGMSVEDLRLDWDALAETAPPLREPLLTSGPVGVRWADPALRPQTSYLHHSSDPARPQALRLGVNQLDG